MSLTVQQLLALQQLSRIGRAKVISIGQYARNIDCFGADGLGELLHECICKKVITGVATGGYSIEVVKQALIDAETIIEKSREQGIQIISFFDETYPSNLREMVKFKGARPGADSPSFLYVKGNMSQIVSKKGIAIIGTREPTNEGVKAGEYFSELFAKEGLNIISGLAIGCDSSAHRGALRGQGITTAFLAHGLDQIYPKQNQKLAEQILDNGGLLISEYPIGTSPRSNYFVERDRLQSGLADGTLVIQTGITGGTMHAVNATIENEKPLYAVQYSTDYQGGALAIHEKVRGNKMLIDTRKAKALTRDTYQTALAEITQSRMPFKTGNTYKQISIFSLENYKDGME